MDRLDVLSPLDGRYGKDISELAKIFSERGLIEYRIKVEGEYLIFLSENSGIKTRDFSEEEKNLIRGLHKKLGIAELAKKIEKEGYECIKPTNHDVKAVEYAIKLSLKNTTLEDSLEWIHFGLTSEDVNNIAYGLMLRDGLEKVLCPSLEELLDSIGHKIKFSSGEPRNIPILARTHGQAASPTTFDKEFAVFYSRLERQLRQLQKSEILVKLNGASGNYNAQYAAFPQIDWLQFTKDFIGNFNFDQGIQLSPNLVTTQIEPHDTYAEMFDNLKRINTILIDLSQDMWRYISDDWITQKPKDGEIGSSTMPHKINPIDFENAEGNLGLANSLFNYFSSKLPISRLQRDLSDSTVERNFGASFGYSLVAYKSLLRGLGKITVNENKVREELENHPEIISEAIQTILRREGAEMPYEKLKELTRGRRIRMEDLTAFIEGLNVPDGVKKELKAITPVNYIGIADKIVRDNIA